MARRFPIRLPRRGDMVEQQIARWGVRDALVLRALSEVPREVFVPAALQDFAYDDAPLPIGVQQTVSQPYIVALMGEPLRLRGGGADADRRRGLHNRAPLRGGAAAPARRVHRVRHHPCGATPGNSTAARRAVNLPFRAVAGRQCAPLFRT